MRPVKAGLIACALLVSAVGGCSAASHLDAALRPPTLATYEAAQTPLVAKAVPAPKVQLGIDIDWYSFPGEEVTNTAKADVAYVKSLHANAISVSFPFFMHGKYSNRVFGTSSTPSPYQLAVLAATAERAGLYVSIRPLLDEKSLGTSRVFWTPKRPAEWFASYEHFLLTYAEMAQAMHIPEFINGTEFVGFGGYRSWNTLNKALRRVYKGRIAYANNWGQKTVRGQGGKGVQETVDAYPAMPRLPDNTSLSRLSSSWDAYDRTLPSGTVETEVDISAVKGAYGVPYRGTWKDLTQLQPYIQTRWFTAACNALVTDRMGGIYFWALGFGEPLNVAPGLHNPASWVDGPGSQAISDCFMRLGQQGA
jgi:hypothetical protein